MGKGDSGLRLEMFIATGGAFDKHSAAKLSRDAYESSTLPASCSIALQHVIARSRVS